MMLFVVLSADCVNRLSFFREQKKSIYVLYHCANNGKYARVLLSEKNVEQQAISTTSTAVG
jgi:hypothetical protein